MDLLPEEKSVTVKKELLSLSVILHQNFVTFIVMECWGLLGVKGWT